MDRSATAGRRNSTQIQVLAVTLLLAIPAIAQNTKTVEEKVRVRRVMVSIPDRKLAVIDGEDVMAQFRVAVGAAESPSPTGQFQIVSRVANPTYYRPGTVIPSGKDNPVGTRWLGLSQKGYGIHGTNVPGSIGRAASHGCIRLRNRDMEQLFTLVRVGDVVDIRGERDELVSRVFRTADESTVAQGQIAVSAGGQ
jgi:lipoprotein-anchoring transpeptidase ErfK/SrfK